MSMWMRYCCKKIPHHHHLTDASARLYSLALNCIHAPWSLQQPGMWQTTKHVCSQNLHDREPSFYTCYSRYCTTSTRRRCALSAGLATLLHLSLPLSHKDCTGDRDALQVYCILSKDQLFLRIPSAPHFVLTTHSNWLFRKSSKWLDSTT